ncbi:MAG: PSP1 domain-containing protein [Acidobacteriota bacterium]
MSLYQVQIENQARPCYAQWDGPPILRPSACVVQTEQGAAFAEVLEARGFLRDYLTSEQVVPFVRVATEEDIKRRQRHRQLEREAFLFCRDQARTLRLEMKLVYAHVFFDESRLLFVYTSENRVDFRELVRILAHQYRMRIEMRQVGVRDEAKSLGGYGHCGQPLCCTAHLQQFYPITIRLAKEQGLSLNPVKISGRCGRLMCCLRYECPARKKGPTPSPAEE